MHIIYQSFPFKIAVRWWRREENCSIIQRENTLEFTQEWFCNNVYLLFLEVTLHNVYEIQS